MADCGSDCGEGRRDEPRRGDQTEPQRDEADVDLAAAGDDVAVDVGARHLREDRLEALGLPASGEDLADAHVRRAGHRRLAVGPALLVGPGHDLAGVAVLAPVERLPDAVGAARAAGVDGQVGVPALDEVVGPGAAEPRVGQGRLVVGGDDHDDRPSAGHPLAVGVGRQHQVAAQHRAVGHGDRQVGARDGVGVLLGPRRPAARWQCSRPPRWRGGAWWPGRRGRSPSSAAGRAAAVRSARNLRPDVDASDSPAVGEGVCPAATPLWRGRDLTPAGVKSVDT